MTSSSTERRPCPRCHRLLPEGSSTCPDCATLSHPGSTHAAPSGSPEEQQGRAAEPEAFPPVQGYRFLHKIGEGGMGAVYLAEDLTLRRRVAIKVISEARARTEGSRVRFLREARAMATLEHPHVVRIYSFGESSGVVHIAMEYVEGESLGDLIGRVGKLSVEQALEIVDQVASALEAAWEKGIVHRDVKPSNILIDTRGQAHLVDFGLAKPAAASDEDVSLTQAGGILGTPAYLAPEQARGEPVDFRTDVYSLGIVLYEMLAGSRPFGGTTPAAVVAHHLHSPLPALREKRPDASPGVLGLVRQMTEKDRQRRPASYAALRQAIADSEEPTLRWTQGSPYRGLAAFDFEHAPVFFGRRRAVEEVIGALKAQAAKGRAFVLVLGMSGSGKSSLVRAGVVPALVQAGAVEGVEFWRRAVLRPSEAAGVLFDGLAGTLLRPEALPELGADGTGAQELSRLLRESPKAAASLVKGALSQAAAAWSGGRTAQPQGRLVLVVDQMEELFTIEGIAAEERRGFIDALSALARSGRAWVLGTLRSDFYDRCEQLPELMALKEGPGQYHLLPATPAEIGQMIRQPARVGGLRFEEDATLHVGLDEVLREAAAGEVGNLPLLEFALEELYRLRTADALLTHAAYRSLGGVEGALAQRAEAVFASRSPREQALLPQVLRALLRVRSGEQEALDRKYAPLGSFGSSEARALVDAFVEARLFVADRGADGQPVVSIAHEALIRAWPRLRGWSEEDRELLRARSRVAAAAAVWDEKDRPDDLLLAEGKPIEEALPLVGTAGIDLSKAEQALIEASERRARGRRRARRIMNANSVGLLLSAAGLTSLYMWKVVPTLANLMERRNEALPLALRIHIAASNVTVRLSPLLLGALAALFLFRRRLRAPEFVKSGMALAVAAGLGLLLTLFTFLVALFVAVDLFRAARP